jgi:LacI family transcriptional regulator
LAVVPKVNQQYIADQLKISRTTVSRCFSNHPAINPETRAQVLSLAAKLGYRYNVPRTESHRQSRKPSTIGVLIGSTAQTHMVAETFRYMLKGVSERAAAQGIQLDVSFLDPAEFNPAERMPTGVRNAAWRGAILIYPFHPEAVAALTKSVSAVSIIEDYAEAGIDCIDTDQIDGIVRLVTHLQRIGHRRIAFLSWPYPVETPWVQRRFGAFVEALYGLDLPFNPEWVINVRKGEATPVTQLGAWGARLVREQGVTAFVCAADHQAYGFIDSMRELGLRVPDDYSVTGFDGIEPPPHLPAVTSLKVAYEDMGAAAVTRLLERMLHPSSPRRHILIGARMIEGATTRAV